MKKMLTWVMSALLMGLPILRSDQAGKSPEAHRLLCRTSNLPVTDLAC